MLLGIFVEAIFSFFWRPLDGATHLFGSHSQLLLKPLYGAAHLFGSYSKLLLKAPLWCYASFWKPCWASFEGPYRVLRISLEDILSFFWRPLYGATHLFGKHAKLLLKAPIWCYASFWNPFQASFEGPYMVVHIFLEDMLSFFWKPVYGATHLFGRHSKLLLKAPIWCYAYFWKTF